MEKPQQHTPMQKLLASGSSQRMTTWAGFLSGRAAPSMTNTGSPLTSPLKSGGSLIVRTRHGEPSFSRGLNSSCSSTIHGGCPSGASFGERSGGSSRRHQYVMATRKLFAGSWLKTPSFGGTSRLLGGSEKQPNRSRLTQRCLPFCPSTVHMISMPGSQLALQHHRLLNQYIPHLDPSEWEERACRWFTGRDPRMP